MTKQTRTKRTRKKFKVPPRNKVASIRIDHDSKQIVFTTKDMIQNQLNRDGPKIRRSFDAIARNHISACSEVFGEAAGLIVRHLPRLNDNAYKPTASRLLTSASNTYIASIEVARHGYRRQYGMLARSFIEAIATVITISIEPNALDEFHEGKLKSTKCIGKAKRILPPLGMYYGMLSDQFVHIGSTHAAFEPLAVYTPEDEALEFIVSSLRGNVWLLYLTAELVFHDELDEPRYWRQRMGGVAYDPSEEERTWMAGFLIAPDEMDTSESQ